MFFILYLIGGNRYIPGATDERAIFGTDPFTGTVYSLKMFSQSEFHFRCYFTAVFNFLPPTKAPVATSQGRVPTQLLIQVWSIPSQVCHLLTGLIGVRCSVVDPQTHLILHGNRTSQSCFCFFNPFNVHWFTLLPTLQGEVPTPQQPSDRRQATSTSPRPIV